MDDFLTRLRETGAAGGLIGLGICTTEPFAQVATEMNRRKAGGQSGRLRFTYADLEVATDIRRTFPWAVRLVVGATTYLPAAGHPGPTRANRGRIARFATVDHYEPLRQSLEAVGDVLRATGHQAEVLIDDNRLVDRAAAIRAGIAWWGKSTMALTPKYGPWTLLGSVATDAELPVTSPMRRDCGTCVACIPACPTGALDEEGTLDATLCISYWAQMPGVVPLPMREAWGDRLYGCDACLDACPPGARWASLASGGDGLVDLLDLLSASDDALSNEYAHFYTPRNDLDHVRRNALVALGHCGTAKAVPVVKGYLRHNRAMLRTHAAWSLGRIGEPAGMAALRAAAVSETDPAVLAEIQTALATRSNNGR